MDLIQYKVIFLYTMDPLRQWPISNFFSSVLVDFVECDLILGEFG